MSSHCHGFTQAANWIHPVILHVLAPRLILLSRFNVVPRALFFPFNCQTQRLERVVSNQSIYFIPFTGFKALEKNTKIFRQHAINRYWILLQDMFWCQFFFPVTDLFLLGKWLRFNNYVNFCDSSTHHFLGNQSFSRLLTLLFAGNLKDWFVEKHLCRKKFHSTPLSLTFLSIPMFLATLQRCLLHMRMLKSVFIPFNNWCNGQVHSILYSCKILRLRNSNLAAWSQRKNRNLVEN